ncbi:oligosaccharide repeat unit polymerase [Macrococcus hajekii]|uniref:Oligosaccharide repeat unit polymerase n=1 Tax=Macrococcus hajekii TaxID=198482 RepID=A0A4R6BNJ5_9STAP|nr:O-antigen polymerase [Macrococcus hajekii]TDM03371.1 oligosaccharide repeat unit polymerase [Macrococcus hajekii]
MAIKNLYKLFLIIYFSILFFYCHLISINYNQINTEENIYKFSFILFISTFIVGFKLISFNKNSINLVVTYVLFWISCMVSMRFNHEFKIEILVVYLVMPVIILLNQRIYSNFNLFLMSGAISILPLIYTVQSSNTFGLLIALGFVCFFIAFTKKENIYLMMWILPIALYYIYLTGSRTTLLSFVIFISFYFIYFLRKRRLTYFNFLLNIIFLIFLVIFSIPIVNKFIELIFHKRSNTGNNFLADRQIFWEGTIKYGIKAWGNGKDFFVEYFSIGDSHNLFIEILGIYGMIPLILFIIFLFNIARSIFVQSSFLNYKAFYFFSYFFLTSLTENLFFIYNRLIVYHFIFLIFVSYIINRQNKLEDEIK